MEEAVLKPEIFSKFTYDHCSNIVIFNKEFGTLATYNKILNVL